MEQKASEYQKVMRKYLHRFHLRWEKISSCVHSQFSKGIHWAKKHRKKIAIVGGVSLLMVLSIASGAWHLIQAKQRSISAVGSTLHFGAIGDFEYGTRENVGNKMTRLAKTELEKVVHFFNTEYNPAFVIELGDMVESSGVSVEKAKQQFRDIDAVFRRVNARTEYVLGNHDLRSLSKEEVRTILGLEDNHRFFDEGDWRFVIMDTNFDKTKGYRDFGPDHFVSGSVPESEYRWLETALATDRPTIVFSHHPISLGVKNTRNYEVVRSFFERYPNIVLSISGHEPSFRFSEENGIHYLVVDNLANRDSLGSFATLDAHYNPLTKEARVAIEHYGPTRRTVEARKIISTDRQWWIDTLDWFDLLPKSEKK
ncbi:MAG: metallophosphoesterase [Candidatus Moraniibacteriota bacterium]